MMFYPAAKRLFDVMTSAVGLVVLAPVLVVVGALIKLDSPGPAFFLQERVGRAGRRFRLWKLRTMVRGAESRGAPITRRGDPRVTRIGAKLRKTKIDELPQLWNVLRGDMSLVGPRPELPQYVDRFPEEFNQILSIRPGITDEASLAFRDEEEILAAAPDFEQEYVDRILPEKLEIARDYVNDMSFSRDLRILQRTMWRLMSR
jgi:lipopolysaccharide/colanic/teichoic acid biosynthesis glycosyltransferase